MIYSILLMFLIGGGMFFLGFNPAPGEEGPSLVAAGLMIGGLVLMFAALVMTVMGSLGWAWQ